MYGEKNQGNPWPRQKETVRLAIYSDALGCIPGAKFLHHSGVLQADEPVSAQQLITEAYVESYILFEVIAFQSGFFWQALFTKAKPLDQATAIPWSVNNGGVRSAQVKPVTGNSIAVN